jgi:hypothetical protein
MRPKLALWSDRGRPDYSVLARPKSSFAARFAVSLVALAVAAVGIGSVYSEVIPGDSPSDTLTAGTAAVTTGSRAGGGEFELASIRPRAPLQSIGLTPIGSVGGPAIADNTVAAHTAAPSRPMPASTETTATAGEPQRVAEAPAPKQDEKQRATKKKYARNAPPAQLYQLPDGRVVSTRQARRSTRDSRYADRGDFQAWGSYSQGSYSQGSYAQARPSRSARTPRPWQFGALYYQRFR